jgi:cytoskeletal protein CcmA (bactofilin family)
VLGNVSMDGRNVSGGGGYGSSFVDVSGGLSVTARVSLWRVLRVRGKCFCDTVVIDGTVC